jgi:hypothetical protein
MIDLTARRRTVRAVTAVAVGGSSLFAGSGAALAGELVAINPADAPPPSATPSNEDTQATVDGNGGATAQAAAAGGVAAGCPTGYGCAWTDMNFGGRRGLFHGNNSNWGSFANSDCPTGNWKNCASSVGNSRQGHTFYVHTGLNHSGRVARIIPGEKFNGIAAFDNNIESNQFG